jgi:phosphoribosylglycinamide formyltransferase-1
MSARPKLRLAILISGRGSNMLAIARACEQERIHATVARVISDRAAEGISIAARLGLETQIIPAKEFADRAAFETEVARAIDACDAQLVVLAGFMRILSPSFVQRYHGRLLNIHPSLLPKYKGLHTHQRVLAAGEREHGSSVHFVTAELDGGPVICQARLPVVATESADALEARILTLEHRLYPHVIGLIATGRLELRGETVLFDGAPLAAPLRAEDAEHELSKASV